MSYETDFSYFSYVLSNCTLQQILNKLFKLVRWETFIFDFKQFKMFYSVSQLVIII